MRRRTCRLLARASSHGAAALLLAGVALFGFGQADPPSREIVPPSPEAGPPSHEVVPPSLEAGPPPRASEPPPRLLLLFDGRVIIGEISEVAGGYAVRRAEGAITVPYDFVRLTAMSLLEAYQKQRDNFQDPNAEQRLTLARWCFRHQLHEQAVSELEAALKLEPFRRDARELLQLIEAAESDRDGAPMPGTDPRSQTNQTSGGISPDNHQDFIRRIQPLLVNKCGNAGCHGSASTNGLRLHNVRTGRRHQRLHSDENLATVLDFVDADFPLHSPLLRAPQDPESPAHRGVFAGPLGEDQAKLLQEWVHAVALDRQLARQRGAPASEPVIERQRSEVGGQRSEVRQDEPADGPAATPRGPRIIEIPRNAADPRSSELLRNVLDEERPDAFDPAEFNRRVHGQGTGDRTVR